MAKRHPASKILQIPMNAQNFHCQNFQCL